MRTRVTIHSVILQAVLFSTLWFTTPANVGAELSRGGLPMTSSLADSTTCDHIIGRTVSIANGRTNYAGVSPGDTVCIEAGTRNYLTLRNFQGTAEQPITFINFGGQVVVNGTNNTHGILFQNSRFFHLTGSGSGAIPYGIKIIYSQGHGVSIGYKSSDFEVDHVEVTGVVQIGISSGTKAVCSDGSSNNYDYDGDGTYQGDLDDVVNRSNFVQRNSVFHDNYIHQVGTEGFYIGSSYYSKEKQAACASGSETMYDPVLSGVRIYDNRVEETGWDGLQVGSATEECIIRDNEIYGDSRAVQPDQQSGIMNNPGSVCDIYNNLIKDGGGPGIYIQGNGGNRIYNNIILNPGQNGDGRGNGISIATGSNEGDSIYVWNNTIINPRDAGILYKNDQGSDNKIQNNIIIAPGSYATSGDGAYINTGGLTNVIVSDNLFN
jgi:parallel beta-helix repeat protein